MHPFGEQADPELVNGRPLDPKIQDAIRDGVPITIYTLACGHRAEVYGPKGATSGRAWCAACGESVPVAA